MARAYLASKISPNLSKTDEGFLICPGVVIARTGWQTYNVKDLPQELAAKLGIDISNPLAKIDLYRRAKDVFSPETMASFEGKPVTAQHPPEFVDTDNFLDYANGHVQNVRRGAERLSNGDEPLLGDLIINVADLIRQVENNVMRELSCGYDFSIDRDGDRIVQIDMVGNHVAVVPKGRAGTDVRINDADTVVEEQPAPTGEIKKEKRMKVTKGNALTRLFAAGLKALALDSNTEPEELADAARAYGAVGTGGDNEGEEEEMVAANDAKRHAADARKSAEDARRAAEDMKKRAKDCSPGEDGHEKCSEDKCMAKDSKARDKKADDARARHHATLDRIMDQIGLEGEEEGEGMAEDEDVRALGEMLNNYFSEEAQEPEHQEGAHDADEDDEGEEEGAHDADEDDEGEEEARVIEPVGDLPEEEEEGVVPANDSLEALEPIIRRTKDKAIKKAFDSAPLDDEFAFLQALRSAAARTNDRAFRKAFDACASRVNRVSRPSTGGYGAFVGAAGDRSRVKDSRPTGQLDLDKLSEAYAGYRNGETRIKV